MAKEEFEKLKALLQDLRSRIGKTDLAEIHDLLWGRNDRDTIKRRRTLLQKIDDTVVEMQDACAELCPKPDPRFIRFLLWHQIKYVAIETKKWDAAQIGASIVAELEAKGSRNLVGIRLTGSVAPSSRVPRTYPLGEGVWLIEPCKSVSPLLQKLEEFLIPFPAEMKEFLESIREPRVSEYEALFWEPIVFCLTQSGFDQKPYVLRRFGIPLIALRNIVLVNDLDTSKDRSIEGYMVGYGVMWGKSLRDEWKALSESNPLGVDYVDPHLCLPPVLASNGVASYDFDSAGKRIWAAKWYRTPSSQLPPMVLLPSLMDYETHSKLIEFGLSISRPIESELCRRIANAIEMWTRASSRATEETWEIGFEEYDERSTIEDPDSLILYSTIVLESLFSSRSDKQEVTSRIADMTAALLAKDGNERYHLARSLRDAYGQRSDFVHGAVDRLREHVRTGMWLFKIATLALWTTVQLVAIDKKFSDLDEFHRFLQKKKYGVNI